MAQLCHLSPASPLRHFPSCRWHWSGCGIDLTWIEWGILQKCYTVISVGYSYHPHVPTPPASCTKVQRWDDSINMFHSTCRWKRITVKMHEARARDVCSYLHRKKTTVSKGFGARPYPDRNVPLLRITIKNAVYTIINLAHILKFFWMECNSPFYHDSCVIWHKPVAIMQTENMSMWKIVCLKRPHVSGYSLV